MPASLQQWKGEYDPRLEIDVSHLEVHLSSGSGFESDSLRREDIAITRIWILNYIPRTR